jgi:uncharacterized delta-60 repeat protein
MSVIFGSRQKNKLFVSGAYSNYNGSSCSRLIGLYTDGSIYALQKSFPTSTIYAVTYIFDNTIFAGGDFPEGGVIPNRRIAKIYTTYPTGSELDGFIPIGDIGGGTSVYSIVPDNNGRVYVGGNFDSYSGVTSNYYVKLMTNGDIDTTFTNLVFNDVVYTTGLDSLGGIYVGGQFSSYNTNTYNYMVKLNQDGTENVGFTNLIFNGTVRVITVDSSNGIYVGGEFTTYDSTSYFYMVKLFTDGTVDSSFTNLDFDDIVRTIAIDSQGKIYVGGDFLNYDSINYDYFIKLNADGSVDGTWTPYSFNDRVNKIVVDSQDNVYVVGKFTNRIIKLFSDGTEDTSFNPGSGFDAEVFDITIVENIY